MSTKKISVVFDASMDVSQIKASAKQIQTAFDNLNLEGATQKSMSKLLSSLNSALTDFEAKSAKGITSAGDFKDIEKSAKTVRDLYARLTTEISGLGKLSQSELAKLFPDSLGKVFTEGARAVQTYESALTKSTKEIRDQEKALDELQKKQKQAAKDAADMQRALQKAVPDADRTAAGRQRKAVEKARDKLTSTTPGKEGDYAKAQQELAAVMAEIDRLKQQAAANGGKGLKKNGELNLSFKENKEATVRFAAATAEMQKQETELARLTAEWNKFRAVEQAPSLEGTQQKLADLNQDLADFPAKIQAAKTALQQLEQTRSDEAFENLKKAVQDLTGDQGLGQLQNSAQSVQVLKDALRNFETKGVTDVREGIRQVEDAAESAQPAVDGMWDKVGDAGDAVKELTYAQQQVDQLKNNMLQFFSVGNAIQLFKRALQSAYNTVKDLDKAMTETAVVTDFSVGDMWDALPKYTNAANELGTTTLGAYQTMTLFYQQGLKTNEVFEIGTETMKMARIAGMDYTEATNMMTAALRGFNMELNDVSAQRVNDVYSELAAITASDVGEISTAMTKTASIAHNANMEFETTSAFLSQIIETTREAPETAGTALKTVIARFQELKKAPSEIGEVDGEIVDANKIETALKTIGVALRDTDGQFRDLDDVFLEISSRWNSLDTNTQRYIATMAAGSRQQSRFIAMMSDYERTMELVDAAHNSAGASTRQFNKTVESLESKLNKLKNAWDAFTMGMMNSTVIKGGVDILTQLIMAINKVTELLPGAAGGLAKLGLAALSLKAGGKMVDTFFSTLKTNGNKPFDALAKTAKTTFKDITAGLKKIPTEIGNFGKWMNLGKVETGVSKQIKEYEALRNTYQQLAASGTASTQQLTNAYNAMKASGQSLGTSMAALQQMTGASSQQMDAFKTALLTTNNVQQASTVLTNADVAAKVLAIEADASLSAEKKQEAISTLLASESQKTETGSVIANTVAKAANAITSRSTIMASIQTTVQKGLETIGVNANTAAWLANLMVIGLVIIAVIALVAAIVLIAKAIHDADPSVQLQKAEKAADAAADAADHAAEAYNNLKDGLDDLAESYKTLESLTMGTDEWREAVQSTNDKVLNLIASCKELAPFVKNIGGVLTLDTNSPEVEGILKGMEANMYKARSAQVAANIDVSEKAAAVDYADLNYNSKVKKAVQVPQNPRATGAASNTGYNTPRGPQQGYAAHGTNNNANTTTQYYADRTLTDKLAEAVARGQIRDEGEGVRASAEKWMTQNGISVTGNEAFLSNFEANYDDVREYGRGIIATRAQQDTYRQSMINNAMDMANIDDYYEVGTKVREMSSDITGKAFDQHLEEATTAVEAETDKGGKASDAQKKEYADMMDYKYRDGKLYNADGTEVEGITDEVIKSGLAAAQATEATSANVVDFAKTFSEIPASMRDEVGKLLSDDGLGLTAEDLIKYSKDGLDLEAIAKAANFDSFADMAQKFGLSVNEMAGVIAGNVAMATDRIVKQRKQTVGKMKKSMRDKSYDELANQLAQYEQKFAQFGINFNQTLNDMFTSLEASGSQKLVDVGLQQMMKIAETDTTGEKIQDMSRFINSVDWSNPIQSVKALNEEIKNGSAETRQLAQDMLEAGDNIFGAGAQMRYFVKSAEFGDMQEDLSAIIAQNGKLAASDILDLADDYGTLKTLMEQTGATAAGLANAFTGLSTGELTVNQLTDAVIAALGSVDSLDNVIADILKKIEDFDPGVDENDVADFVNTAYETLNGNLEKGAVGNSQNWSYLDFLLGPDWDEGYEEDALFERMKYIRDQLEKNSTDMQASWKNLSEGKDFYGEGANMSALGGLNINQLKDGSMELTGFEGMTTDQVVAHLAEAYRVSEEYAEMMLADFSNYSINLRQEMEKNDVAAGLKAAYEELNTTRRFSGRKDSFENGAESAVLYQKIKTIDSSEIEAISAQLKIPYDEAREYFESRGALITEFYDKDGFIKSNGEIIAELDRIFTSKAGAEAGARWVEGFAARTDDGRAIIDYEAIQKALADLNIPEATRRSLTNDLIQSLEIDDGIETEVSVVLSDGEEHTIEVTPTIDVATAIANAEQDIQNAKLGEAIANAFGDIDVTFTADDGSLTTITTTLETAVDSADTSIEPAATDASTSQITSDINAAVDAADTSITIYANTSSIPSAIENAIPQQRYITVHVREVTEHASGIKNSPDTHTALIGEEGPELVQTKDGAYLADGPQFAQINRGDTVYTADETKKILNSAPSELFDRYATGYRPQYNYKPYDVRKSNSDSNKEKEDIWENPYDWLYNLTEEINENLRQRNLLEKKFQLLQKKGRSSYKATLDYYNKQFKLIKENYELEKEMYDQRKVEMSEFQKVNSDMQKYGYYDAENGRLVIDWDLINSVTDTEEGEAIEKYISKLEEIQEAIEEAEEAMVDAELAREDLKQQLLEAYLDFETRVAEALQNIDQKEIDKLDKIYEAVNDAGDDLLDAMKEQIDEYRKTRDNEDTEEDIAKKERRLAYLRQDTSGANSLEILKLQDELDKAREDYQDQLVDQALENLQAQNDAAIEQREKEIALMQSQLDWNVETGVYTRKAAEMIEEALATGNFHDSKLYQTLFEGENWMKLSATALQQAIKEAAEQLHTALTALKADTDADGDPDGVTVSSSTDYMAEMQKAYRQSGGKMTDEIYELNRRRNAKIAADPELAKKYPQLSDAEIETELAAWFAKNGGQPPAQQPSGGGGTNPQQPEPSAPEPPKTVSVGDRVTVKSSATRFASGARMQSWVPGTSFEVFQLKNGGAQVLIGDRNRSGTYTGWVNRSDLVGFKTGGLADFTGPAWLDGTKSRPEMVLNARDTENFIELRDILRESIQAAAIEKSGGNSYQFDIDIHDPHVESDYDVDAMVARVEQDIYEKATYRNVNAVSQLR